MDGNGVTDTPLTQETAESESEVKFPKRIKYRGRVLATIYAKSKNYPCYRVVWTVAGKRLMKGFPHWTSGSSCRCSRSAAWAASDCRRSRV